MTYHAPSRSSVLEAARCQVTSPGRPAPRSPASPPGRPRRRPRRRRSGRAPGAGPRGRRRRRPPGDRRAAGPRGTAGGRSRRDPGGLERGHVPEQLPQPSARGAAPARHRSPRPAAGRARPADAGPGRRAPRRGRARRCGARRHRGRPNAGDRAAATRAAAPAMTPSSTTGTRRAAQPRTSPARPACSSPPTSASRRARRRRPGSGRRHGHDADLAGQHRVVDAGAAAGDPPGLRPGQVRRSGRRTRWCCRSPCRRWRGTSYPASTSRPATRMPVITARAASCARHRRPDREVVGAGADLAVQTTASSSRSGATPCRRRPRRRRPGGEHVDCGPAGAEVRDHRGGHLLRPRRHALA